MQETKQYEIIHDTLYPILPELDCKRCGHKWTPEKREVRVCPRCKNKFFWQEKSPLGRRPKTI